MSAHLPGVLIVDDEAPIRKFLRISLGAQAFRVIEAENAATALRLAGAGDVDLIVLDLGLPDADGKDLITALGAVSRAPIIVLSIRASEQEKIAALDAGASDYVTKPFAIGELTARLRALLRDRPSEARTRSVYEAGTLRVDVAGHRVFLADCEVKLTPKEFALLVMLVSNRGRVVTHRQLLVGVWGESHAADTHYLRVFVGQLRQKLNDDPTAPRFIENEPGIGYRFAL